MTRPRTNVFCAPEIAARYESWYSGPGRRANMLEKRLLENLLGGFSKVRDVLEIGCGTGHFSRRLADQNLDVTGLDISPPMLAEARKLNGICYQEGDALDLKFDDRSYELAVLITRMEFVADPRRALVEAVRIARHGLVLGVLNCWG